MLPKATNIAIDTIVSTKFVGYIRLSQNLTIELYRRASRLSTLSGKKRFKCDAPEYETSWQRAFSANLSVQISCPTCAFEIEVLH